MSGQPVPGVDRREFIVTAAAAAAAVCLPVALAATSPAVADVVPQAQLADWTVDDMWGVYPRPSEPIGYCRPRGDDELLAVVHPADLLFLV